MISKTMKVRPPDEGEEFNVESGYVIFEYGDPTRSLCNLSEVLEKLGVTTTKINGGFSDIVLKFEKNN